MFVIRFLPPPSQLLLNESVPRSTEVPGGSVIDLNMGKSEALRRPVA